jgi:hypothetical protein
MSTKSVSLGDMFGWVSDAFKLVQKDMGSFMAASAMMLVLVILMVMPIWLYMFHGILGNMKLGGMPAAGMPMVGDMGMFYAIYAVCALVGLLLYPPMVLGWIRLCQGVDQDRAVSGMDIFKPYQDKTLWTRGIGFAVLAFLIYMAIFALVGLAFGGVFAEFMQQVAAQQAASLAGVAPSAPHFPSGLILAYIVFIGVALLLQFIYMIGFGELALGRSSVLGALQLGLGGVLKNLLKLIVFLIAICLLAFIVMLVIGLVLGAIVAILMMIQAVLGIVVAVLIYIAVVLCLYPLMFAFHYLVWKSIVGSDAAVPADATDSTVAM